MIKPYTYTIEDEFERLEREQFDKEIKKNIRKFINDLRIKQSISEIRRTILPIL